MTTHLRVHLSTRLPVYDPLWTERMTLTANLLLLVDASLDVEVGVGMQIHHLTRIARHGLRRKAHGFQLLNVLLDVIELMVSDPLMRHQFSCRGTIFRNFLQTQLTEVNQILP